MKYNALEVGVPRAEHYTQLYSILQPLYSHFYVLHSEPGTIYRIYRIIVNHCLFDLVLQFLWLLGYKYKQKLYYILIKINLTFA